MKKLMLIIALCPLLSFGQFNILGGKNIIKTNLMGLAIKNYNITYERSFLRKFSLSLGYRTMPKTNMPKSMAENLDKTLDNEFIKFDGFQMGNTAITAELRFYVGLKRMGGFYIAPYYRNATFDLTIPVKNLNDASNTINLSGKIKSSSLGLLLGKQWILGKFVVLDFWILGGHYGSSKGSLEANGITNYGTPEELNQYVGQQLVTNAGPFKVTGTATSASSARIDIDGPWVGIRSMSLCLGIKL